MMTCLSKIFKITSSDAIYSENRKEVVPEELPKGTYGTSLCMWSEGIIISRQKNKNGLFINMPSLGGHPARTGMKKVNRLRSIIRLTFPALEKCLY